MAESRPRRPILKQVSLWTTAGVLLLTAYMGSWLSMHWLHGRGVIGPPMFNTLHSTVFAPVALYCGSDLPGSKFVSAATGWSGLAGGTTIILHDVQFEWTSESSGDRSDIPSDED